MEPMEEEYNIITETITLTASDGTIIPIIVKGTGRPLCNSEDEVDLTREFNTESKIEMVTVADLDSADIQNIYYQDWSNEQQSINEERYFIDDLCMDIYKNRFFHAVNITANNEYFLELLESRISNGIIYIEKWLSDMMGGYALRCCKKYQSEDYSKYATDWLNNTSLILNNKYPVLTEWIENQRNDLNPKTLEEIFSDNYDKTDIKGNIVIESKQANNKISSRLIKKEELYNYFIPSFKGIGNNINLFDIMIEELNTNRNAKEFGQIALMIYKSGKLNDRRPKTFAAWYKLFCESMNIKQSRGYKPSNLKTPSDTLKKLFNYL